MLLMGLPMRYPRFFIVLFVALGLAALPAADAYAAETVPLPDALRQIETMSDISQSASIGADLARRGGIVDLLARRADLNHSEADRLLDAVTGLVVAVAGAGERAGVLVSPEIDPLLETLLNFIGSTDPASDQALAKAGFLTGRAIAATELMVEAERTAMDALISAEAVPVAGPVERWRSFVERYFPPERIEEALLIIDCESNGDPDAHNSRSGASGLFQFLDRTWSRASEEAGFQGESPFSPEANVAAAAWLVEYSLDAGNSAWVHWTCRP